MIIHPKAISYGKRLTPNSGIKSTHCVIWPCEFSSASEPWKSSDNVCTGTFIQLHYTVFQNINGLDLIVWTLHNKGSKGTIKSNETVSLSCQLTCVTWIQIWLFCGDLCDRLIREKRLQVLSIVRQTVIYFDPRQIQVGIKTTFK